MASAPKDVLELYQSLCGTRWALLAAQGYVESRWDSARKSPAGAQGVAQFMPATWRWAVEKGWAPAGSKPTDPVVAIPAQASYMDYLRLATGYFDAALAAYNWGIGHVKACVADHPGDWQAFLPRETFAYIREVTVAADLLRLLEIK